MKYTLCLLVGLITSVSAVENKPNILLVLTDDQGWPTLECYGGKVVPTPHLNKLADNGVMFTDAYVTSQCTPTRAALLSGQYPARNGMWHVIGWYGFPHARMTEPAFVENYPREAFTVAKGLKKASYTTGIMGKWHLTTNEDGHYKGINPKAAHHYGFDYAAPVTPKEQFEEGADRGVELLTTQALDFIKANKEKPWFCFLSHHMIHGKVVAPKEIVDKYRQKGFKEEGYNNATYLAGLECIDRSIGQLLEGLKKLGEYENTVIVFISDNGGIDERLEYKSLSIPQPEAPQLKANLYDYDNAPLRAGKGSIYEGGVRVPLIIHWPKSFKSGTKISTPVHGIDLVPTFLELAGSKDEEKLDGVSLLKTLSNGSDESLNDRPIFQYSPIYDLSWGLTPCASIRKGDYKLIEFFGDRFDEKNQYVPGHHIELYNLKEDIAESKNLAQSNPAKTKELLKALRQWMKENGVEASKKNPHFDKTKSFLPMRKKPDWLK